MSVRPVYMPTWNGCRPNRNSDTLKSRRIELESISKMTSAIITRITRNLGSLALGILVLVSDSLEFLVIIFLESSH